MLKLRRNFLRITAFLFLIILLPGRTFGQETDTAIVCPPVDLADILRKKLNKPPKAPSAQTGSLLLVPIIGSNPATGFMFGVGGQYTFKMPGSSLYSILSGSLQATTKNQFLVILKNTVYTKQEKIFLTGDWRYQIYSQSTYGLGTNSPEGGVLDYQFSIAGAETNDDSLVQPMKFNFIRFHQTVAFKIKPRLYLGVGYNLDGYSKIQDERLRLNPGDTLITAHYAYNTKYGFDTKEYFSSALNATLVFDSRDNMIQAHKGCFLSVAMNGQLEFLGSEKDGSLLHTEWRSFHGVSRANPAHLISFWVLGDFASEGKFPYMILPATGYDQRSRSGRGYTQGRFRGSNYMYAETEYRFPISKCSGPLSGVVFLNGATADNPGTDLKLFESVKPGYGVGLRILLDKKSRSNLVLDYGLGDKSSGFYLAVSETF